MTGDEWRALAGYVAALWPATPWPDATITMAGPLFAKVELAEAKRAVDSLAADGERFAPPPAVILRRVDELPPPPRPQLAEAEDPEPTAEELERAARWRPQLAATAASIRPGPMRDGLVHAVSSAGTGAAPEADVRARIGARLDRLPPPPDLYWHGRDGRPCPCEDCSTAAIRAMTAALGEAEEPRPAGRPRRRSRRSTRS